MVSVYDFSDHRAYLRSYYAFRKRENHRFSYQLFSRRAGFRSNNYLKLVMDGRKGLSIEAIHRFAAALGLDADEHVYFEILVLMSQAKRPAERQWYAKRLRSLRATKPARSVRADPDALLAHWHCPVVLLWMAGKTPGADTARLSTELGVSPGEIERTMKLVQEKGWVVIGNDGCFRLSQSCLILHDPSNRDSLQKAFLRDQLTRSMHAFKREYPGRAKFHSHAITASRARYGEYVQAVAALVEKLNALSDTDEMEEIVQLNVQIFPVCGR